MNIVTRTRLEEFWKRHVQARAPLLDWYDTVLRLRWRSIGEVRQHYPHADLVPVKSGRKAVVFNIAGNKYRLVTAIHYPRRLVYVMRVLTHAEYDKDLWKEQL